MFFRLAGLPHFVRQRTLYFAILSFASMHHSSSAVNAAARLSAATTSAGTPDSSNVLFTDGTGYIAGTVHARIFHSENCSAVMTCVPPNTPSETVEMATGFLRHSSVSRSMTFLRLAG